MTDEELVARLKTYDEEAYREVVARFGDSLYGYIYTLTGDHHISEDILSETYLRMIEKIDTYRYYGAPFKAWLYRIAHNLSINTLRRSQRTVAHDLETVAEPADDPAAAVVARLESEELRDALSKLTEDQQQVLLLRFVADQTSGEVAKAMDKSENAVKQLQWRALRTLGRLMERREQE